MKDWRKSRVLFHFVIICLLIHLEANANVLYQIRANVSQADKYSPERRHTVSFTVIVVQGIFGIFKDNGQFTKHSSVVFNRVYKRFY